MDTIISVAVAGAVLFAARLIMVKVICSGFLEPGRRKL